MDEEKEPSLRVEALHALEYCERLFYLQAVEELSAPDERVYAGRTLHETVLREEEGELETLELADEALGLHGKMDALRRRDGRWVVYEHKRGRPARDAKRKAEPWPSDRLQAHAYAMLLEAHSGQPVEDVRVRYHAENVTVRAPLTEQGRAAVRAAVARARELRAQAERPPVTTESRRCARCSLAPVCLPEEERLAQDPSWEPVRLAVRDDERQVVHVVTHGTRVGRSGEELELVPREGEGEKVRLPVYQVGHVVVHGAAQLSTQALHLCVEREVAVSWFTTGGRFVGTLASTGPAVQRRVRQYRALTEPLVRLRLAQALVAAKVEAQLRFVLRATRGGEERPEALEKNLASLRGALRRARETQEVGSLLGCEGEAARAYFACWQWLLGEGVAEPLRYVGRTRRPPKDRVSALLGFGYALLLGDVTAALVGVGLEPALGFYHQPRSSAPPLALDLMELFRVPLVEMPVVASLNRGQWDAQADFVVTGPRVWLSDSGRRRMVELYERRKAEEWKHSVVGYALSYVRMIELEARLLEKEWSGAPGLFARFRLR